MSEGNKIRATGLWRHESKNGVAYYSGTMGSVKVLVFENNHREGENAPALMMYFAPNERPNDREGAPRGQPGQDHTPQAPTTRPAESYDERQAQLPASSRPQTKYPLTKPAESERAPPPRAPAAAAAPPRAPTHDPPPGVPQRPLGIDEVDIPF